jgi:hypothetical protein
MEANHALNATITIPMNGDGSTSATVFANTPVAIVGIVALSVLGVGVMLTQEHWRPLDPQPALAEGNAERSNS